MAELTTDSVVHGVGSDTLRIGAESDRIVCEVHDSGQLKDPLAARRPPHPTQPGGRGLLLVHPLADLVRVHTGPRRHYYSPLPPRMTTTTPRAPPTHSCVPPLARCFR
ncbi:ATP-binding protein [Streptomyces sp. NPDC095613]|uniref:ATP-binding protein n=1 Tax=Streptomyces sp. NPDC095613 TaxID=3155540 RepID=UPI003333D0E3